MTANIQQHVIPRRRTSSVPTVGRQQSWNQPQRARMLQQGSVTQSTITISFAVMLLISIMTLGFFYLQQVFSTASHGTGIQALEQEMVQLREQQKELELQGAQLRSIQSVEQRVDELNLVAAEEVAYLAPVSEHVAFSR